MDKQERAEARGQQQDLRRQERLLTKAVGMIDNAHAGPMLTHEERIKVWNMGEEFRRMAERCRMEGNEIGRELEIARHQGRQGQTG